MTRKKLKQKNYNFLQKQNFNLKFSLKYKFKKKKKFRIQQTQNKNQFVLEHNNSLENFLKQKKIFLNFETEELFHGENTQKIILD